MHNNSDQTEMETGKVDSVQSCWPVWRFSTNLFCIIWALLAKQKRDSPNHNRTNKPTRNCLNNLEQVEDQVSEVKTETSAEGGSHSCLLLRRPNVAQRNNNQNPALGKEAWVRICKSANEAGETWLNNFGEEETGGERKGTSRSGSQSYSAQLFDASASEGKCTAKSVPGNLLDTQSRNSQTAEWNHMKLANSGGPAENDTSTDKPGESGYQRCYLL